MSATVPTTDDRDDCSEDATGSDVDGAPNGESANDARSNTERLRAYLARRVEAEGECYVKGKFIGDEVGLTPKQIGQLMVELRDQASELDIEKWSYTGATTWRIAPDGSA